MRSSDGTAVRPCVAGCRCLTAPGLIVTPGSGAPDFVFLLLCLPAIFFSRCYCCRRQLSPLLPDDLAQSDQFALFLSTCQPKAVKSVFRSFLFFLSTATLCLGEELSAILKRLYRLKDTQQKGSLARRERPSGRGSRTSLSLFPGFVCLRFPRFFREEVRPETGFLR